MFSNLNSQTGENDSFRGIEPFETVPGDDFSDINEFPEENRVDDNRGGCGAEDQSVPVPVQVHHHPGQCFKVKSQRRFTSRAYSEAPLRIQTLASGAESHVQ